VVMDAVGLRERLEVADVAVTGEGTFDQQSMRGKGPAGVLRAAEEAGVRSVVLCGRKEVEPPGVLIASVEERVGIEAALQRAGPFLALTSGSNRADPRRLAQLLGVDHVRTANAEEARAATGFAIGGTPLFGHPEPLEVVIDRDLLAHGEVWAAVGPPRRCFRS